jgi:hypothetical protein
LRRCSTPSSECSISFLQDRIHIKKSETKRESIFAVEKQKQKSFSSQKGSPQGTNEQASKFKEEEVLSVTVRRREL